MRDRRASPSEAPAYDPDELYGILPDDIKRQFDMREIIARMVDGSRFHEYQPNYGTTLVCGFANIWGFKVGILANNGVLFNDCSLKGAHFIELCNQNETPLLFLQNITGYMVGREYERKGITKDGAKMIMAQGCSRVPKFTVMCNGSFGAGNYGMCGRAFDGRFAVHLAQPSDRRHGRRAGRQYAGRGQAEPDEAQRRDRSPRRSTRSATAKRCRPIRSSSRAYHSTSELWDDGILDPVDTRNALGIAHLGLAQRAAGRAGLRRVPVLGHAGRRAFGRPMPTSSPPERGPGIAPQGAKTGICDFAPTASGVAATNSPRVRSRRRRGRIG